MPKTPDRKIVKKLICLDEDIARWLEKHSKDVRLSMSRVINTLLLNLKKEKEAQSQTEVKKLC